MAVLLHEFQTAAMTISTEERDFFIELGARIAELRKVRGITQVQLAETLGVSQQTIQAYEVGRRRIQVSALPVVARILGSSLEELFGEKESTRSKRGPASQLQRSIERISELPKTKQKFVIEMLDAMVAQAQG